MRHGETQTMKPEQGNFILVIPVYNDWSSLTMLLPEIDQVASESGLRPQLVVIDDGSSQTCDAIRESVQALKNIKQIDIVHLARNLGHQKAIALGLAYVYNQTKFDQVMVIDCDGEDRPEDISLLLDEHAKTPDSIIFAQRARRSEGVFFRFFYAIYKLCFRVLTGAKISFGNFVLIPAGFLRQTVYLPEIWNHLAAGIMHAKLPWRAVPTVRGLRKTGRSKMNFVSLVIHGLSAISIFIEILAVRLMIFSLVVILFGILGFLVLIFIKYFTPLAIPGWATTVAIGLVIIMFQAILFLALLLFLVLNYRTTKLFIPVKDYKDYVLGVERFL